MYISRPTVTLQIKQNGPQQTDAGQMKPTRFNDADLKQQRQLSVLRQKYRGCQQFFIFFVPMLNFHSLLAMMMRLSISTGSIIGVNMSQVRATSSSKTSEPLCATLTNSECDASSTHMSLMLMIMSPTRRPEFSAAVPVSMADTTTGFAP